MYLLHHKKNGIYANICLFLSYSEVTVATRSSPYPDQMVTAAPWIQSISRSDGGSAPKDDLYSPGRQRRSGHLDEPQRQIPILSPRRPSGQDLGNQMSPLHNLTLLHIEQTAGSSGQRRTAPPTEPGFFQGLFLHSVTDGVLVPCRCCLWLAYGDTKFPVISSTWLHKYYLNWTELDDDITEFNDELPLTQNWVLTSVFLHYRHTIFLFDTVKLLWHNLYC